MLVRVDGPVVPGLVLVTVLVGPLVDVLVFGVRVLVAEFALQSRVVHAVRVVLEFTGDLCVLRLLTATPHARPPYGSSRGQVLARRVHDIRCQAGKSSIQDNLRVGVRPCRPTRTAGAAGKVNAICPMRHPTSPAAI